MNLFEIKIINILDFFEIKNKKKEIRSIFRRT